jgi:hypothetical protein
MSAILCACSLHAASTTTEGPITLVYDESPFSEKIFKKEFGNILKVTCNWRVGDFFGKETVFANITVKNTSAKPMYFNYYVAFFDKNGRLVGSTGQGSFGDDGIKPGDSDQMGSCLIHLPAGRYKDIATYQAVIYETDTAPKKK